MSWLEGVRQDNLTQASVTSSGKRVGARKPYLHGADPGLPSHCPFTLTAAPEAVPLGSSLCRGPFDAGSTLFHPRLRAARWPGARLATVPTAGPGARGRPGPARRWGAAAHLPRPAPAPTATCTSPGLRLLLYLLYLASRTVTCGPARRKRQHRAALIRRLQRAPPARLVEGHQLPLRAGAPARSPATATATPTPPRQVYHGGPTLPPQRGPWRTASATSPRLVGLADHAATAAAKCFNHGSAETGSYLTQRTLLQRQTRAWTTTWRPRHAPEGRGLPWLPHGIRRARAAALVRATGLLAGVGGPLSWPLRRGGGLRHGPSCQVEKLFGASSPPPAPCPAGPALEWPRWTSPSWWHICSNRSWCPATRRPWSWAPGSGRLPPGCQRCRHAQSAATRCRRPTQSAPACLSARPSLYAGEPGVGRATPRGLPSPGEGAAGAPGGGHRA